MEVQAPRVARVVRTERTRPIAAVRTCAVEGSVAAVPCRRQEYEVAVCLARYLSALYAVHGCPLRGGVAAVDEFLALFIARHAPVTAPKDVGGIVLGVELRLVVSEAVVAVTALGAVLGHGRTGTFTPLVGAPVECGLS